MSNQIGNKKLNGSDNNNTYNGSLKLLEINLKNLLISIALVSESY